MDEENASRIVAHCTSSVLELEHYVEQYDDQLAHYQETGNGYKQLQETIENVGETWEQVDTYKQQLDSLIADLEVTADNGQASWTVQNIEGLLHTTEIARDDIQRAILEDAENYDDLDDDVTAAAIYTNYEDLATFNETYLQCLSTIAHNEADVLEDDRLGRSPEQIRMEDDNDYRTLNERIQTQIDMLEDAQEQF